MLNYQKLLVSDVKFCYICTIRFRLIVSFIETLQARKIARFRRACSFLDYLTSKPAHMKTKPAHMNISVYSLKILLYIEPKVHDITVFDDVGFAFHG